MRPIDADKLIQLIPPEEIIARMAIANAPTIVPDMAQVLAYECGKASAERPKGEWIKEPNGKTTDLYRCSVCNRSIMLCKGADLTKYPFCHCGAKMEEADNG